MQPHQPPGIVADLLAVIHRIREAVADIVRARGKSPRNGPLFVAWMWLETAIDRITRLAARHEAGKLRPPAPRQPHASPHASSPVEPEDRRIPLRYRPGWLAAELEGAAASLIAEFEARLADPALQSLLEAEPARCGALLRPLCRALGLTPPEPIRDPPARA